MNLSEQLRQYDYELGAHISQGELRAIIDKVTQLEATIDSQQVWHDKLKAENERLWEFYTAHCEVEKGIVDFDLHNQAVERLRNATKAIRKARGDVP